MKPGTQADRADNFVSRGRQGGVTQDAAGTRNDVPSNVHRD